MIAEQAELDEFNEGYIKAKFDDMYPPFGFSLQTIKEVQNSLNKSKKDFERED